MDIQIREARKDDVESILPLGKRFWDETNSNGLTFNSDNARKSIAENIGFKNLVGFCAVINNQIIGYIFIYYENNFTDERIGRMSQFFVDPEYRKTTAARGLVRAAVNKYKEWRCARCYCEASPEMFSSNHLALFKNLWGKFGYNQVGITLMKEY